MANKWSRLLLLATIVSSSVSLWAQGDSDVLKSLADEEKKMANPVPTAPIAPPPAKAENAPAPAPAPETTAVKSAPPEAAPTPPPLLNFLQPYDYIANDRRDPFAPPLLETPNPPPADLQLGSTKPVVPGVKPRPISQAPLERFDLDQLRLTAIMWDIARPKAMIRDPQGSVHIIVPNQKIGRNNGYVAVIREGEIVVVEPLQDEGRVVFSTRLMKLQN